MNCPKCGEYNPDGTVICGNCRCSLSGHLQPKAKDKISYYTEGQMLCSNEQYGEALDCFLKSAELGYSGAYRDLGDIYYYGKGVAVNYSEAAKWYQKAVDEYAAFGETYENLAVLYRDGKGVNEDLDKAIELYKNAIEFHKTTAVWNGGTISLESAEALGRIYESAPKGIRSYNLSLQYYEQAVELGSENIAISTYRTLAEAYGEGIGRPVDNKKAEKYYRKVIALDGNDGEAHYKLATIYHRTIDEGGNVYFAEAYYRKALELGCKDAQKGYNEVMAIRQKSKDYLRELQSRTSEPVDEKTEWRRRLTRTCPRCGRNSGHPIGEFEKKASVGFWGFGSRMWGKSYKCDCCDYMW